MSTENLLLASLLGIEAAAFVHCYTDSRSAVWLIKEGIRLVEQVLVRACTAWLGWFS